MNKPTTSIIDYLPVQEPPPRWSRMGACVITPSGHPVRVPQEGATSEPNHVNKDAVAFFKCKNTLACLQSYMLSQIFTPATIKQVTSVNIKYNWIGREVYNSG